MTDIELSNGTALRVIVFRDLVMIRCYLPKEGLSDYYDYGNLTIPSVDLERFCRELLKVTA